MEESGCTDIVANKQFYDTNELVKPPQNEYRHSMVISTKYLHVASDLKKKIISCSEVVFAIVDNETRYLGFLKVTVLSLTGLQPEVR